MSTILITGGTGVIGVALTGVLTAKGHRVILLSRQSHVAATAAVGMPAVFRWDPSAGTIDPEAIRQADIIIHLAGAGIADKRWTAKRKRVIEESRTQTAALLVKALREIPNGVRTVISASGIGWYGADAMIPNPRPFEETDPADAEFLGETCRRWEEAIAPVTASGKRLVIFRIGPVLTPKGGALKAFLRPVKLGMAAILGSGRQVLSWIHIDDICRLVLYAAENEEYNGIYNAVAPQPVDNRTLMTSLARRLKGRYFVPVYIPSFLLKIALGGLSIEVLKSTTVSAGKVRAAGFQFLYPSLDGALDQLIRDRSS
ncbi:MAG TPA: TIGR01777 family oxidoreductase [Puia sp.]|jgi:uncharacterized protein (TIGR01777 family)|nr:TIGR01777 family oxidoreductase [Puia sp.]